MNNKILSRIPYFLPFSVSVFLGALLLFQVQPIIGKYILPWFGGSSSVWTTAVLFFEVMLVAGYLYAYLLSRVSLKQQLIIHSLFLGGVLFLLFVLFFVWSSPITPPVSFKMADSVSPVVQILALLLLSIGLPYFVLSTTSSLLAHWYSFGLKNKTPYTLYSLSNAGSLLGILAYPFFIEIFFSIRVQGILWSVGFVMYIFFILVCVFLTKKFLSAKLKSIHTTSVSSLKNHTQRVRHIDMFFWLVYPLLSSVVLLATTNQITQAVAPVPFLWLLPLGLYLLSFVICFSDRSLYNRIIFSLLFLTTAVFTIWITLDRQEVWKNLLVYAFFLFSGFMLLHGELYRIKPHPRHLNLYYFFISLGGALGGAAVVVAAPMVFNYFWEFYVGIYFVSILGIFILLIELYSFVYRRILKQPSKVSFFVLLPPLLFTYSFLFVAGYNYISLEVGSVDKRLRNFYGVISVDEVSGDGDPIRSLYNGEIRHGSQYLSEGLRGQPTTYYGELSGVGLAILHHPKRQGLDMSASLRVGVVGLGVGTLAAYGEEGDVFTFYEINPDVIAIAHSDFTYLRDSEADIQVVLGDARLSMEKELQTQEGKYDILAVDAFTDDAIPVHLLTREAIATYLKILDDEGILAIHISNQFLDLQPVLESAANEFSLFSALIDDVDGAYDISGSTWVLLSRNNAFFDNSAVAGASSELRTGKPILWTDDYSNLFQVLEM